MEVIDYSKLRKRGKGQGLNTGLVVKAQASRGPDLRDRSAAKMDDLEEEETLLLAAVTLAAGLLLLRRRRKQKQRVLA